MAVPRINARLQPIAFTLLGAAAFAGMAAMVHLLRDTGPWTLLVCARLVTSLIMTLAVAFATGQTLTWRGPKMLWARSLIGALCINCTFYAYTHLPVTDAVTLISTNPVWIVLFYSLWNRVLPGAVTALALVLLPAGVLMYYQPTFSGNSLALGVALAASMLLAVAELMMNSLRHLPVTQVVAHFTTVAAVSAVVFHLAVYGTNVSLTISPLILMVGLLPVAALATIGQLSMTTAFSRGSAILVGVASGSEIGFAALYDFIFWDRLPTFLQLGGLGLILAAVMCVLAARRDRETVPIVAPN